MFWIVEYLNGTSSSENEIAFKEIETNNIKKFYLLGKDKIIGFEGQTGIFFIDNMKFDFKTGNGPFKPIQFKTGVTTFDFNGNMGQKIVSRNVGYSNVSNNFICKYILNLHEDSIYLNAIKCNLDGKQIDSKRIRIK